MNCNVTAARLNALQAMTVTPEGYIDASAAQAETALASMGVADLLMEKETVVFAGTERPAMRISGSINGVQLHELFTVLKEGDLVACITMSSAGKDATADLLTAWTPILPEEEAPEG